MRRRTPAVALAVVLVLTACSSGGDNGAGGPPPTEVTTTTLAPFAPLTGLPLTDQARLSRPALVVKVENAPASRPQSGLDVADVVYEEIVEGGITRFLAVFHSTDADLIGPVRSLRPSDPDIIAPFGGLFAYSGGIPNFVDILRKTPGITDVGVDLLDEGPDKPYTRRAGRTPPNNLYTSTSKLYARAPRTGTRPPGRFADFLPAGQAFTAAGASPAVNLTATIGITTVVFNYDGQSMTYRRSGLVEGAGVVAPTNLIVQFTSYEETDETDLTNTTVEKAVTVGSGDAIILSGGVAVRGRWSRPSATAFTTYTDASGAPIRLSPGRTWVELARNGAAATTR
ncbi:MAG TPA: DUF3048 domain-containing protein [Acidimicrobiales bacterium]|nr:DUF3048 domain-containing protein [Acidimicrobiales bacterium]